MDSIIPPSRQMKIASALILFLFFMAAFEALTGFGAGIGAGLYDSLN